MSDSNQDVKKELAALAKRLEAATAIEQLRPIFYRADEIAKQFPDDFEIQVATGDIQQGIAQAGERLGLRPASAVEAKSSPPAPVADVSTATPQQTNSSWRLLGVVLIAALAVGATAWLALRERATATIVTRINTSPTGASISIDGKPRCTAACELLLPPGSHVVGVALDGYRAVSQTVTLTPGHLASPVEIALVPLPQSLRVVSSLGPGSAMLDDAPAGGAHEGEYRVESLPAGHHTFKAIGTGREASFGFEVSPGKMPTVSGALVTKNALTVLVATLGHHARLVTSSGPWKLVVNGAAEGEAGPAGVDLKNLKEGQNELVLGEGAEQRTIKAAFTAEPALTAFLLEAKDAGTLTVSTGEDGVRVFVNGVEQSERTAGGQLRLRTLGAVAVRVRKDGFDSPPLKKAEVQRDGDVHMIFHLTAKAHAAPPQPVEVARAPVAAPAGGVPNPAPVAAPPAAAEPAKTLEPAKTAKGAPAAPPTPAAPVAGTMADFENPGAWRLEDRIWRHRGEAFLAYKLSPNGVFVFEVFALRGGHARWTVAYSNSRDYTLFELDDQGLGVFEVTNGSKSKRRKPSHGLDRRLKNWTVQIDVSPARVTHSILRNKSWFLLDTWTQAGRDFTNGKFAFLIQGNDEIGLADFQFNPHSH